MELVQWQQALSAATRASGLFNRAFILPEAASTQDLARDLADGRPGAVVTVLCQTAGRGRLGRAWNDSAAKGVALTCVVDASQYAPGVLPLAAGLAAAQASEGSGAGLALGLKWPNDVVTSSGEKLAGVLIEQTGTLAYIGIGINVEQSAQDFPPELAARATSLRMLGAHATRLDVTCRLITALAHTLLLPQTDIVARWSARDAMKGTRRALEHNGAIYRGTVTHITPLERIDLLLDDGRTVSLPVATTSVVKEP